MPALTFLGAAGTVTGSKHLLELDGRRILVDCGLFQGLKPLRERNWQPLPVDPGSIDGVILTHAHLDHSGYLPRLAAEGYRGRIFCTSATADLCRIVLPDAGRLQEEYAEDSNRGGYTRHAPALPLYRESDAYRALSQLQPAGYNRSLPVAPGVEVEFVNAGHLLGSSYALVRFGANGARRTVCFGGDLGRYSRPVLPDPAPVESADVLLLESTYGDRLHAPDDDGERLAVIVRETLARGGKLIVPAFAIGRVEEVIYWLRKLELEKRIPELPVFVDSPMALEALKHYENRAAELDPGRPPRVDEGGARQVCQFCTSRFQTVSSPQQSRELVASKTPAIVISASGMATGGRVLHHLLEILPDSRHTVLFVGYQAAGTRGRRLIDGEREVKIHGRMVPVNARIEIIESMSAHADQEEILRWLGHFRRPPEVTFLVHGEPPSLAALRALIVERLGWRVEVPEHLARVGIPG